MFNYWNTSFEIKDGLPTTALLPIAAIEQHGPHLPVASDWLIVEAIAEEMANRLEAATFRLPVFPYGTSASHADVAGTVSLSADTLFCVVRDVVESLYAHGITRVVVVNNHGIASGTTVIPHGNFVVKSAVRQVNYDHPAMDAIWVQPFAAARTELAAIFDASGDDVHAGDVETSVLLHLRGELVKGRANDFVPKAGREFLDFVPFSDLCPAGVWGRPSQASADKGARAFEAAVTGAVEYVAGAFKSLDQAKGRE